MGETIRKLAAIMFTDLVGYSSLTERNEALSMEILVEYRAILRAFFDQHHGREIRTMGDGFFVEFSSAVEAVSCAIAIQKKLRERNDSQPGDRRIMLRIGIHSGDVVQEGGDVYGTAVNVAARIEPLARPGGICVTRQVYDQVRTILDEPLVSMGTTPLKNIEIPVEIFRVATPGQEEEIPAPAAAAFSRWLWIVAGLLAAALVGGAVFLWMRTGTGNAPSAFQPAPHPQAVRSLAVLPLSNFSGNPSQEYFADGMTDVLITHIADIGALKVISRTSTMRYKGSAKPLPQIARELNVDVVLEGSVTRERDRVEINVRLVDARADRNLWAKSYERNARDLLPLEREVARAIAQAVRIRLSPREEAALARTDGAAPEAYDAYLNGLYHWNKRTREDMAQSIRLFQEALELDPSFAPAYAGLANAYCVQADWGYTAPPEVFPKIKDLAARPLTRIRT